MEKILLGVGALSWPSYERKSDRYGTVNLNKEDCEDNVITDKLNVLENVIKSNLGKSGTLSVKVLETRQSKHIGDFFRGVRPTTPKLGEEFELGSGGKLFSEVTNDGILCVGLKKRKQDNWLDIHALYKAHEQTVELYFTPD